MVNSVWRCCHIQRFIARLHGISNTLATLQWRHNGHDSVSNHQPHHCLLNRLFGRRSKKTSKLCVTGLFAGNSSGTGEFPALMASNAENVSIWWRHHECMYHMLALSSSNSGLADSTFAPSQWETALLCNDVSHWRGANLESAQSNAVSHWLGPNLKSALVTTRAFSWMKTSAEFVRISVKHFWIGSYIDIGWSNGLA